MDSQQLPAKYPQLPALLIGPIETLMWGIVVLPQHGVCGWGGVGGVNQHETIIDTPINQAVSGLAAPSGPSRPAPTQQVAVMGRRPVVISGLPNQTPPII